MTSTRERETTDQEQTTEVEIPTQTIRSDESFDSDLEPTIVLGRE